jgi:DNA polymerase III subunit beta
MKIICTQENLKTGLLTVGRIISSSNSLPILNNILIKTENGVLTLSSTNLEIAITTHVRCKIEEEGELTVLSKTITDLVNNLPNKNIILQTQNGQVDVETENYHTSIKTLPAEEFPLIPQVEDNQALTFDAQELKTAIDQVVFSASTNQTQPEISGVLFAIDGNTLKVVATDRYRLAEKKLTMQKNTSLRLEVIVPQKTVIELSRIIGSQKGSVEVVFNETQISLCFNETQIISRLVDGQYPDYKQIIPTSLNTTVVTQKQPLVSALRAGAIFSQNTNSVKLEYSAEKQALTLISESQELGKSVVDLPSKVEGKSGVVILNHHYILDCLSGMDSENVLIKIIDDSSPSLIVPENKNDYIYLVMPIKS